MIQPSKALLNYLFEYDPSSGKLYWKNPTSGKVKSGDEARTLDGVGYKQVRVNYQIHKVHRLVWIMHFGLITDGLCIDHIDGDGLNNRISNLRTVTNSGNQTNRKTHRGGRAVGVTSAGYGNKWKARLPVCMGGPKHLGTFNTKSSAILALKKAVRF